MNLILLDEEARHVRWKGDDRRAVHVRKVLRLGVGASFFVGVGNGRIGKARILEDGEAGMVLETDLGLEPPAPLPVHLLVGLPRPQTARRLLREIPSLGAAQVTFFLAGKSEPSYRSSKLWSTHEWKQHLHDGVEQAFTTHIPKVDHADSLAEAVQAPGPGGRIAFDLYEAARAFEKDSVLGVDRLALAFGPEGGWTPAERDILRAEGFALCVLGPRVMRVETAIVAATSLAASHLGRLDPPLVPGS